MIRFRYLLYEFKGSSCTCELWDLKSSNYYGWKKKHYSVFKFVTRCKITISSLRSLRIKHQCNLSYKVLNSECKAPYRPFKFIHTIWSNHVGRPGHSTVLPLPSPFIFPFPWQALLFIYPFPCQTLSTCSDKSVGSFLMPLNISFSRNNVNGCDLT